MEDMLVDEQEETLLGQCPDRKLLGAGESSYRARAEICYPRTDKAGSHGLDGFLQSQPIAFGAELPQPHAIRATLARGTAQKGRVNHGLRTTRNRGKVTSKLSFDLTIPLLGKMVPRDKAAKKHGRKQDRRTRPC